MANQPNWTITNESPEWRNKIWEYMAWGAKDAKVGTWLDEQDHHLDRRTVAHIRLELKYLPEELAASLKPPVQRLRSDLRREPVRVVEPTGVLEQLVLVERWREHWRHLLQCWQALRGIGVFAPGAREMQNWLLGPDPSHWPIPGGQVQMDQQGKLWVKLWLADQPEGESLQQHLPEHRLWETIEKLRAAMAEDLTARRGWYLRALAYGKEQLELPVSLEEPWNCGGDPQLLVTYGNTLYEQLFRQVAGLPFDVIDPEQFGKNDEERFCYQGTPIMAGCSPEQEAKAAALLIQGQQELARSAEAQSAGAAYWRVKIQTEKLKESLDGILALTEPPPGSACDQCRNWSGELKFSPRQGATVG